jgi:hypothetical protein
MYLSVRRLVDRLDKLKDDCGHTSYDSVIRELLREYEYGE